MARKRKTSAGYFLFLILLAAAIAVGCYYRDQLRSPGPAPSPIESAEEFRPVRIATWNIRQLGGRASTDIRQVAKIITDNNFDVVAIQEVFQDGRGVDALLNALGHPWRGTRLGGESRSGERLTFVYRGDRVTELASAQNLAGATDRVFERIPYSAAFRCGRFDWEMVTVHLSWGDAAQREYEAKTLANLVAARANQQSEKDILILGDFNEQKSRPNLHYIKAIGWQSVVVDGTNLSGKERYDHIIFSPAYTAEYTGNYSVVRFDETVFGNDDKAASAEVSDHRPVFADFRTDRDDD